MKLSNFLIGVGLLLIGQNTVFADGLSDIKQLAEAASPQLALQQLDKGIAQTDMQARPDWQREQWLLLSKIGRPEDVLKRAASLSADAPADVKHMAAKLAAQAAIAESDGGLARTYLAQLLWILPADAAEYREFRKLVVQSHLLPQPDVEAASVMLRYQQEFGVDAGLLHIYALAMLQAEREADVTWVRAQLPQSDALVALIDARYAQLSDADIKQRLQIVLNSDANASMLLMARNIAAKMNVPELQIQINEHLLNLAKLPEGITAEEVWKDYRGLTQSFGNVRLLLFGSDAGWADLARESVATNPVMARAIWAYLARNAKDAVLRSVAQQQFLELLLAQHMDRTALRLFVSAWPGLPASTFNSTARYRLGQVALDAGEYDLAAGLWQNLDAVPEGANLAGWQLRSAVLFARQGAWSGVANNVSLLLNNAAVMASTEGLSLIHI